METSKKAFKASLKASKPEAVQSYPPELKYWAWDAAGPLVLDASSAHWQAVSKANCLCTIIKVNESIRHCYWSYGRNLFLSPQLAKLLTRTFLARVLSSPEPGCTNCTSSLAELLVRLLVLLQSLRSIFLVLPPYKRCKLALPTLRHGSLYRAVPTISNSNPILLADTAVFLKL